MKRRTFTNASGVVGISTTIPWGELFARKKKSAKFLKQQTSNRMLFPRPANKAELKISPVGFAWLPCPGAVDYQVDIFTKDTQRIYSKKVGPDPVHLPDRVFPAGKYTWDVTAFNNKGTDISKRGIQSYTILPGAAKLPWIKPAELLKRVPVEHSRIIYPKVKLTDIRATLTSSRAKTWKIVKSAADRFISKGIPEYPTYHKIKEPKARRLEYNKYFKYIRGYIDSALISLALGFLMTENKKYSHPAKRILLELATWPTNEKDVTSVSAKWGDEPGLSFSKCVHLAYDWLYPAFSNDERKKVFKMCKERAWQTYHRLKKHNYLTNPGESHDGRLIAYLSDMSLAMAGETEDAETWLEYSLKALLTFYPHWGGINGGWAEGIPYGLWYNSFYIPAFESLRQLADFDLWQRPFFNQIRYFFFYCTANHGEIRPFGDAAESGGPGVNRGNGYAELMAFHAHQYSDPYIGWWVSQIPGYKGGKGGFSALLFEDKLPSKIPNDLPGSRVFKTVGWAGLHSDITRPKEDTCLIFKSSPYGSVSHSHADQNAFAIMKGGAALAIPSGYYGPSYGHPHHAKWTRSTKANNCILVNGNGQKIRSRMAKGKIIDFKDNTGYTYVAGDSTSAYMGKLNKWIRRILFLRPGIFLLLDEIEAPSASKYQWMLHALEKMDIKKNKITLQRRNAVLDVYLECLQELEITQTDQFDTPYNESIPKAYHKTKANHWHVTAETVKATTKTRIAAIMSVYQDNEKFDVQLHNKGGWLGVTAMGKSVKVEGWIKISKTNTSTKSFSGRDISKDVDLWGQCHNGEIFSV